METCLFGKSYRANRLERKLALVCKPWLKPDSGQGVRLILQLLPVIPGIDVGMSDLIITIHPPAKPGVLTHRILICVQIHLRPLSPNAF